MKQIFIVLLSFVAFGCASAPGADPASESAAVTSSSGATESEGRYIEDLSAKEKHQLEDQLAAEVVEEHNESVENDLDEVVCENVTITGSRKKQRLCRTRREILAEKQATRQMMMQRNRSSSVPPLPTGADFR